MTTTNDDAAAAAGAQLHDIAALMEQANAGTAEWFSKALEAAKAADAREAEEKAARQRFQAVMVELLVTVEQAVGKARQALAPTPEEQSLLAVLTAANASFDALYSALQQKPLPPEPQPHEPPATSGRSEPGEA